MEWYIIILIIAGIGLGLCLVYIFLRQQKIIGSIPILSNVIDPILNAPFSMMETYQGKILYYETKRPKTGHWNPKTTESEILGYIKENGQNYPEQMIAKEYLAKEKMAKSLNAESYNVDYHEDYAYNQKTGILDAYGTFEYSDEDGESYSQDIIIEYDFKKSKVEVKPN